MPEISTVVTYQLRVTSKEFKLITSALAYLSGLPVKRGPEEIEASKELNRRFLEIQAGELRQYLTAVERKRTKADEGSHED